MIGPSGFTKGHARVDDFPTKLPIWPPGDGLSTTCGLTRAGRHIARVT
jgi:hypothetical protein